MVSNLEDVMKHAQAGEQWAQRMLTGHLALAADDAEQAAALLDEAAHWARQAARGCPEDFAVMLFVLMKRGALPDGDAAGGEAIARLEIAAERGHEESAAQLQRMSDMLPPDASQRFFARAKTIIAEMGE